MRFPTCEPKNKIITVKMSSAGKSIGTCAMCLCVKRTQVDTDDLSRLPPKISKTYSNSWASAKDMLFKVIEPSSSLIPRTCLTTIQTRSQPNIYLHTMVRSFLY
ncbi:hypothetical protein RchiOBHm_Chr4g0421721 [Rosa chinensis]|uniref:Uncharacterized protein n=1 Tax=Rosa chinensis TaxID=74649 RepID=A0A2P6QY66_ROSCH|nr:hypothetical protein RchiOBHm_Chr4g0421721 [Rosa chinensis]